MRARRPSYFGVLRRWKEMHVQEQVRSDLIGGGGIESLITRRIALGPPLRLCTPARQYETCTRKKTNCRGCARRRRSLSKRSMHRAFCTRASIRYKDEDHVIEQDVDSSFLMKKGSCRRIVCVSKTTFLR